MPSDVNTALHNATTDNDFFPLMVSYGMLIVSTYAQIN